MGNGAEHLHAVNNTPVKGVLEPVEHPLFPHTAGREDPWTQARANAYFGKHEKLAMSGTELAKSFQAAPNLFNSDGTMEVPRLV